MKTRAFSIIVGIALALFAIYHLHAFMLIDTCLDRGGQYLQSSRTCINEAGHEYFIVFPVNLFVFYFVVGLVVAAITALIINKILMKYRGHYAET